MKTVLPIRKCPRIGAKHSGVAAIGVHSDLTGDAPFQICRFHLPDYQHLNWRFRVVMLEEYLKYPCFRLSPDKWCSEISGHSCLPAVQPETGDLFEQPGHQPKLRRGRGDLI